jgi:hypothetical protein
LLAKQNSSFLFFSTQHYFAQLSLVPYFNQETTPHAKHLLIWPFVTFRFLVTRLYSSRTCFAMPAPTFLLYMYSFFETFSPKNSSISWVVPHYFLDLKHPPLQLPNPYFAQTNLCHETLGLLLQVTKKNIYLDI